MMIELVLEIIASVIGLGLLWKAIWEYMLRGRISRAELLYELRKRLKDNRSFDLLTDHLDSSSSDGKTQVKFIEYSERRKFASLLEHIGVLVNSGLIKKDVAFVFYGYVLIQCWESDEFWHDMNRNSLYWRCLKQFYNDMIIQKQNMEKINKRCRLKI